MIRKYAEIFCWKNVSSFCSAKATHIFSSKNIRILYFESAKTVNEMTLNKLVKLTTLWTTGPWLLPYFTREMTFVTFCLFSCTPDPFRKGIHSKRKGKEILFFWRWLFLTVYPIPLTLVLLNPDILCLCKQCRSRSVGFWRSQLIWICTVCHLICEFTATIRMK